MTYEQVVARWAAAELGVPAEEIAAVTFDYDSGDGCPTCGYEGYPEAIVRLTTGQVRHMNLSYEFPDLIKRLVDIARGDASE